MSEQQPGSGKKREAVGGNGAAAAGRIAPEALGPARGFSHGWLAPAGARILFVAGQTAASADGAVAEATFLEQFDVALGRALTVVAEAGGTPEHVMRMTVFVTDMEAYLAGRAALGEIWRRHMGRHYPAMALLGVTRLVDAGALVEIEVTAALPPIAEETA